MTLAEFRLHFLSSTLFECGPHCASEIYESENSPETVYRLKSSNKLVITAFNMYCVLKCPYYM